KAVDWIRTWGDSDQDGFLEYMKKSKTGLDNQGWKDSHDSVMYQNGELASPPIKLCEVQAYAYRALAAASGLALVLGQNDYAQELSSASKRIQALFLQFFWDEEEKYVYLALDGKKQPCKVMSSNQGHCLWTKILPQAEADHVARHLMSARLFSGY